ncbi:hypothetical protein [Nonomuraea typhae]|uniref:hypothetical protein n=1 Tax=Nonomuraea typhae TaxID=2603600 RepID=UPI0012FAA7A4|nr:hypothetical protein [Nonomuraea typhae]
MRRLIILAVAVLLLPLLTAAPALAKGISHGRLTGPGLRAPIDIKSGSRIKDDRLNSLRTGTSAHAAIYPGLRANAFGARPKGGLGPCYRLDWYGPPGDTLALTQYVYPYARRGAVIHTPSQAGAVQNGWLRAPGYVKRILRAMGLPKKAPRTGACPVPAPAVRQ